MNGGGKEEGWKEGTKRANNQESKEGRVRWTKIVRDGDTEAGKAGGEVVIRRKEERACFLTNKGGGKRKDGRNK